MIDRAVIVSYADEPTRQVYFFEDCIASQVASLDENSRTEVGLVGREGMSGSSVILEAGQSPHEVFIQVGPGKALAIEAHALRDAMDASPTLRRMLLRFVHCYMIQTARTAVSNSHNSVGERLSRWLLMCHDRIDGDDLVLTHEFMAIMLAVRRAGVTVALHELEGAGLIRSKRGVVTITNRAGLEQFAGACYGVPEAEYRRLIGPFGKTAI